ncbi:hypothetical protein J7E50_03135 [Pedobacter sp. ISL-68]|uniref:hypothetical protein n=1 Tax=unclassified Pedobacter TaxID=2628915 RepID=UPI001BE8FD3C|nr:MULTISPECIES: hypothetical protein [unclassified Pedobacter]MBT2560215.1 hypothetical protein [Pedobacter sp. ISL-64]MBT2589195.1 hypothetical protein [Pedobacter sp. ISL-68]
MKILLTCALALLLCLNAKAQTSTNYPLDRVMPAPQRVVAMFKDDGMKPFVHELTAADKEKVEQAFAILPPLHQRILKKHLHSITFLDSMPNTALTADADTAKALKTFDIIFRAGILKESLSDFATWKENTGFDSSGNSGFSVEVNAGVTNALQYVLLHEATHIVDKVLDLTPSVHDMNASFSHTPSTMGIWQHHTKVAKQFNLPTLEKSRFRSGNLLPVQFASEVYRDLNKTPFPSLYATSNWHDDIAELLAIYHMTKKLKQPYFVVVKQNGRVVYKYEPMKNQLVKKRLKQLDMFYNS